MPAQVSGHHRPKQAYRDNAGALAQDHIQRLARYAEWDDCTRTAAELQHLPRNLEVLAFEADCEDYCEREVDEFELQGGRVYLHLGARRDEPPRP